MGRQFAGACSYPGRPKRLRLDGGIALQRPLGAPIRPRASSCMPSARPG